MGARINSAVARVAAVASRQYGVISRAQLLECGLSHATITRWARDGHLHRLHRGVYAVGHTSVSREGRWLAATLAAPGSVVSHGTAARLHYLDRSKRVGTLEISVPFGRTPKPHGVWVHRPRALFRRDITERRGIPTTTPTRTVFDQASKLRPKALRELFEQAEYLDVLDRPRLSRLLDGATGRRGLGELRRLANYEPLPLSLTRSKLERLLLKTCRTYDLPLPEVGALLLDYEVDFLWERARFVVETDGGQHVGEQRDRDNARDLALQRAGFLVRRYSEADLEDPEAIAAEVVGILRERAPRATSSSASP